MAAGALAVAGPAAAAPLSFAPCKPAEPGFECGTLRVPVDRSGVVSGTIGIRVARQVDAPPGAGTLLQLFGGPGQGAASSAPYVLEPDAAALRHYRLVLIDQRGTGRSSPISCPALQGRESLDPPPPAAIAACATSLGDRRAFFTTTDSVDDIEALRVALGAPKLAIEGTSYGTYVALQYARRYPASTDRLVLDSIVEPSGGDTFGRDSFRAFPRVLRDVCHGGACTSFTSDPAADARRLVVRLQHRPISGLVQGPSGTRRRVRLTGYELFNLLLGGYLNEPLRALAPGAVAAALRGDTAGLLRLVRPALGPPEEVSDLSEGLFNITNCTDTALSYPLSTPISQRGRLIRAAADALTPAQLSGLPPSVAEAYGSDAVCRDFPASPLPAAQDRGAPADVPALILSGSQDAVTPLENGIELARLLPKAQRVVVPGTGHDTIDSDASGCVQRALRRFFGGTRVGSPCDGVDNGYAPLPPAPRSLRSSPRAPGVAGLRGRVVHAVGEAVFDTSYYYLSLNTAGFADRRGPGLRGGIWEVGSDGDALSFHGVSAVPGVRVTGTLRVVSGTYTGTLRVRAPSGLSGVLTLPEKGSLRGRLGGRAVAVAAAAVNRRRQRRPTRGSRAGLAAIASAVAGRPRWWPGRLLAGR